MAKSSPKLTVAEKAEKEIADKAAAESATMSPEKLLEAELKKGSDDHYNFEETVFYRVSTGSLNMDMYTGGGVTPGLFVVSGPYESGKTSFTLACMKNMLDTVPNSRGFLIKAEGRLSLEMQARVGIKFVFDAKEWTDGTCFVLETNVWEFSLNMLRSLVGKNPLKKRYFIFIDSMDGMSLKDDIAKDVGTANKVAGGPALTKQFLQKMSNAMTKRGHVCAVAGQVSAAISIDPRTPAPSRAGPGGGGNAKDHWANHIFIFKGKYQDDFILEKQDAKIDRVANPVLGHWVKILIKKSPNEKSNIDVQYPVKYGRTNGDSVWREYEIVDMLSTFGLLVKSASWYKLTERTREELIEKFPGTDIPIQLQGEDNWRKYLENNRQVADYLYAYFMAKVGTV